ncbi:MAG TPA: carbohydrate ABC transporter permease [Clostridiaceae bacterium]|nr:carbohydrate ABC transporter permease [Clostridiaceae bacterium]
MKRSRDDIIFETINTTLVTIFFILVLYPLVFVLSASISDPTLVSQGKVVLLPKGINFDGYRRVLEYPDIWLGYRNTIFYAIIGTILSLMLTLTAAYPLSRKDFIGKNIFVIFFTITMFFSGGLIPTYMVIKSLGIRNTIWAQIIPGAVSFMNIVVVRTFYQTSIPDSLQEAAAIDGCSIFRLFLTIILPLAKPIIAVMGLFYGVAQWNSYFKALIYISDRKLFPLQLILREILIINQIDMNMLMTEGELEVIHKRVEIATLLKYAVIVVSTLPVIAAYPFLQKYFVKGIMVGAIKG